MKIRSALISSHTKDERVTNLAKALRAKGVKVYASGGTCSFLAGSWMDITPLENITGFANLLGGRVKTLHPAVFAGILARDTDRREPFFDLVAVDLYPFEDVLRGGGDMASLVEMIDIGGVALLRAAAKNHAHVLPVAGIKNFPHITELIENSATDVNVEIDDAIVRQEAIRTFRFTSFYDSLIAAGLSTGDNPPDFDEHFNLPLRMERRLRYGENPHQRAAHYTDASNPIDMEKLWGKELSYNNLLDIDGVLFALSHFKDNNACVIVKHTSPCGIAIDTNMADAYKKALASDSLSAFGGIAGFTGPVDKETALLMHKHFFEVILAPDFEPEALTVLQQKKNLRLLRIPAIGQYDSRMFRSVCGGVLVSDTDAPSSMPAESIPTGRKPTEAEMADLAFAWQAVRAVKSNAVLIAKDKATLGIGGGVPSRVDAAMIAVRKAAEKAKGAVAASDAFFPFPDGLETLAAAGITAVVQPGGSRGDQAVIEKADELGIAMIFTGQRVFRH